MLLPLTTIMPSVISRLKSLLGHEHGDAWKAYFLVAAAFVPWLSVADPLVTILFIERYRNYVIGHLILRRGGGGEGGGARVGPQQAGAAGPHAHGHGQQLQIPMTTMMEKSKAPSNLVQPAQPQPQHIDIAQAKTNAAIGHANT